MAFARTVSVTHTKTLVSPSTGVADKVYGVDYVSASSHTGSGGLSGATSGGIPYFDSATSEASSALLAANAVVLGGGAGAAPLTSSKLSEGSASGQGLINAAGTSTTDVAAISSTVTFNNAGVTFTGAYRWSITDQAANAGSGASSVHTSWLAGTGGLTEVMQLRKDGVFKFGSSASGTKVFNADGAQLYPSGAGGANLGAGALGFGGLFLDYTNTATVGAVTINKPSGRVIMGAGASTFTLTNSKITAASHVLVSCDSDPGNAVAVQVWAVEAAGSCTINARPAVTNQTTINFVVVNAD